MKKNVWPDMFILKIDKNHYLKKENVIIKISGLNFLGTR